MKEQQVDGERERGRNGGSGVKGDKNREKMMEKEEEIINGRRELIKGRSRRRNRRKRRWK